MSDIQRGKVVLSSMRKIARFVKKCASPDFEPKEIIVKGVGSAVRVDISHVVFDISRANLRVHLIDPGKMLQVEKDTESLQAYEALEKAILDFLKDPAMSNVGYVECHFKGTKAENPDIHPTVDDVIMENGEYLVRVTNIVY